MSEYSFDEIIQTVIDLWSAAAKVGVFIGAFISLPLWIIPYAVYNKLKYDVWF